MGETQMDEPAVNDLLERVLEQLLVGNDPASPPKIIHLSDYGGGVSNVQKHLSNNRFQVQRLILSNSVAGDVGIKIGTFVLHFMVAAGTVEVNLPLVIERGVNLSIVPSAAGNVDVYIVAQVDA